MSTTKIVLLELYVRQVCVKAITLSVMVMLSRILLLAAMLSCIATSLNAQHSDEAIIREMLRVQTEAWNQGNGNAWAKDFTDDADFVNIRGDVFHGRNEIVARHTAILEEPFKGSHLSLVIRRFTLLTRDAALIETDQELTGFARMVPGIVPTAPDILRTHMKYAAFKSGGGWHFVAAQNSAVLPPQNQTQANSHAPTGNTPVERPHWWIKSDWWLVIIAGLTGGFIGWQSWETRRAAKAAAKATQATQASTAAIEAQSILLKDSVAIAEKSANAALLNAQAVINSERPWVTVTPERNDNDTFILSGIVKGRTPAKIISGWSDWVIVPDEGSLLDTPPYSLKGSEIAHDFLAVPGDHPFTVFRFSVWERLPPPTPQRVLIDSGTELLFFYGRILYTDILILGADEMPERRHETRWCYRYVPSFPSRVVKAGKPAYNLHT